MPHSGQTGVYFESGGHRLLGTLFLAQGDAPKPTVLLLHGLPGIEKNYDLAHSLRDQGINSLIFHYRGCWGSGGTYTFKTIPDDVIAAMDYLASGAHPQVDAARLGLAGHSMGGWAAVLAAARDPRPKAAAIYGAVCDPREFTWGEDFLNAEFTPWLPGLTNADFTAQWAALDAAWTPSEQAARLGTRPLLVIHSQGDDLIPLWQAEALHRAGGPGCTLLVHPDANHSFTWHRPWLCEQITGWLAARL